MICECGNPKTDPEACDRCLWLDGTASQAEIIRALRDASLGLTLNELAQRTRTSKRNTWKHLKNLLATNRLRRFLQPRGIVKVTSPGAKFKVRGLSPEYVYTL